MTQDNSAAVTAIVDAAVAPLHQQVADLAKVTAGISTNVYWTRQSLAYNGQNGGMPVGPYGYVQLLAELKTLLEQLIQAVSFRNDSKGNPVRAVPPYSLANYGSSASISAAAAANNTTAIQAQLTAVSKQVQDLVLELHAPQVAAAKEEVQA